ncbi:MAG: peptidase M3A and M3B thimet/oligopeptidase F, partial [Calditrichae bacterium]|nr:peptidase M3A and M3B thimet/oligopeptidase F [Calditrichia bacterium]
PVISFAHSALQIHILASQIYYHIGKEVLKSENVTEQTFYGKKEVGTYLIEEIFKPGALYHWNDMIAKATNEKLTAKYYALQFIE